MNPLSFLVTVASQQDFLSLNAGGFFSHTSSSSPSSCLSSFSLVVESMHGLNIKHLLQLYLYL